MVDYADQPLEALRAQEQELRLVIADRERQEIEALFPAPGTPITAADAVEKYPGLKSIENIRRWGRDNVIKTLAEGRPGPGGAALYDEQELAIKASEREARQRRRVTQSP